MAPLPVIANTYRCRMVYDSALGVQPTNVFHVQKAAVTPADIADAIEAEAGPDQMQIVGANWNWVGVDVTKLDGATATFHLTFGTAVPGQASGQSIINLSGCLNLFTARRGSRGRGRLFLGPTTEDINTGGNVGDATELTICKNAWSAFFVALGVGHAIQGGVASYQHADFNALVSSEMDPILRSTKSRLNQITR